MARSDGAVALRLAGDLRGLPCFGRLLAHYLVREGGQGLGQRARGMMGCWPPERDSWRGFRDLLCLARRVALAVRKHERAMKEAA